MKTQKLKSQTQKTEERLGELELARAEELAEEALVK